MIVLPEVAQTLQDMLNANTDSDLVYMVNTPGFHLDKISDRLTSRNFIPVFISSLGGQINPVPILKQVDATIPVTFYFPVRFKEKMFLLNEYLNDTLVGKTINWGTLSGSILTNISLPRYGEIQDLDLKQFKSWVNATFETEIEVMEPFITMEVSLYLSAVGEEFIFGNNIPIKSISISYKEDNNFFLDEHPICVDRADIGSSEPAAQQLFSDTHTFGFPANLAYTKQLPLIVKDNEYYYNLLNVCENTKDIQNLIVTLTEEIPVHKEFEEIVDGQSVTVIRTLETTHVYYVTNYSRRTSLGQLLGISLTLADLREEEEESEE